VLFGVLVVYVDDLEWVVRVVLCIFEIVGLYFEDICVVWGIDCFNVCVGINLGLVGVGIVGVVVL